MAKKLGYADRKKMLEARDSGLTDEEMKARFGIRDKRTIDRHLKLAEQERDVRLARVEIMKDALAKHLAEVLNLIERWQGSLHAPPLAQISMATVSPTSSIEADPLFNCLKEHLPFQALWRDYSTWNKNLRDYIDRCQKLIKEIEREAGKWPNVRQLSPICARPILERLDRRMLKEEPQKHKFGHVVVKGENQALLVDNKVVLEAPEPSIYESNYGALSDRILHSKKATSLITLFSYLRYLETKIHDSLQEVRLRRDHIMYTCRLCPAQTRLSSR